MTEKDVTLRALRLGRVVWGKLSVADGKDVLRAISAVFPNARFAFEEKSDGIFMTPHDDSEENHTKAVELERKKIKGAADLEVFRLQEEERVRKVREEIEERRRREELAKKAPPGSLSVLPEPGDSSKPTH